MIYFVCTVYILGMEQRQNIATHGKEHAGISDTLAEAFEAPRQAYASLECQLFPRKTEPRAGRRYVYVYEVTFDGETIVTGSPDPDFDLARALLARGITGKVTLVDGATGKPRTLIDIEKAAKLRTAKSSDRRSRFVPYVEGEQA